MDMRERFETWAVKPPREWNIRISGPKEAWPGSYWSYSVQCAWEAWQAANITEITPEMIGAAEEAYMPFGDMGFALQAAFSHSGVTSSDSGVD